MAPIADARERPSGAALRMAILASTLTALSAIAAAGNALADTVQHLDVDGVARTYLIHIPDRPAPPSGFPLVLAFHGGGGRGAGMSRLSGLDALADARGFIVVYPDGLGRHWNDGRSTIRNKSDDVGFVDAILDELEANASVDPRRVFATGISNGAMFAHRLACERADRIAAIAAVAGTLPHDLVAACAPRRPVSVLQIEGTDDPIMPYDGGAVADFGGRGEGGIVLSASTSMTVWSRIDGCAGPSGPTALTPVAPADPTRVMRTDFGSCRGGTRVELLTVEGGGHAWPGGSQYLPVRVIGIASRQLDASSAIVDFFLSSAR